MCNTLARRQLRAGVVATTVALPRCTDTGSTDRSATSGDIETTTPMDRETTTGTETIETVTSTTTNDSSS